MSVSLWWVRQDMRLADNAALTYAAKQGPLVALYVADDSTGQASQCYLHHALEALSASLAKKEVCLIVEYASSDLLPETVLKVAKKLGATSVSFNRTWSAQEDISAWQKQWQKANLTSHVFNANLFFDPTQFRTKQGQVYKVFTPFWKTCLKYLPELSPCLPVPEITPAKLDCSGWRTSLLESVPAWSDGFWVDGSPEKTVGETLAFQRLANFVESGSLSSYLHTRNHPAKAGTSMLSSALHFGEISAKQVYVAIQAALEGKAHLPQDTASSACFLSELGWREFAYHQLANHPDIQNKPLKKEFARFPWKKNKELLTAWQKGLTGYPIIDAGMRELDQAGLMHNRIRMVVASFLVKHLLQPWQDGAQWFLNTLLDADVASNSLNWQWVAGSGFDSAPYFRVFNPVTQAQKFDESGEYIRRWVPELASLPNQLLFQPSADIAACKKAGVVIGESYPKNIVDHAAAREKALSAWYALSKSTKK